MPIGGKVFLLLGGHSTAYRGVHFACCARFSAKTEAFRTMAKATQPNIEQLMEAVDRLEQYRMVIDEYLRLSVRTDGSHIARP